MTAVASALGRRIATLRAEAGMTQEQLATRLDSNKSVVSRIENGMSIPSVQRLVELADVFGVGLRDLFDSESAAKTDDPREVEIAEIAATLRRRPVKDVRRIAEMLRVLVK